MYYLYKLKLLKPDKYDTKNDPLFQIKTNFS